MIRTRVTCLFAIISVVMLSGCASIISKSVYPVRIEAKQHLFCKLPGA